MGGSAGSRRRESRAPISGRQSPAGREGSAGQSSPASLHLSFQDASPLRLDRDLTRYTGDRGTAITKKMQHLFPTTWLWTGTGFSPPFPLKQQTPGLITTPPGLLTTTSVSGRCTCVWLSTLHMTICTLKTHEKNPPRRKPFPSHPPTCPNSRAFGIQDLSFSKIYFFNLFAEDSCHIFALTRTQLSCEPSKWVNLLAPWCCFQRFSLHPPPNAAAMNLIIRVDRLSPCHHHLLTQMTTPHFSMILVPGSQPLKLLLSAFLVISVSRMTILPSATRPLLFPDQLFF